MRPPLALLAAIVVVTPARGQYPNLDLDLPKQSVSNRASLVAVIPAGTRKTFADLEGPGCIRHVWATHSRNDHDNRNVVIRIFFDEVHTVKSVELVNGGKQVHVVVHWEASVWNPPAPKSDRISCIADQTWEVARNAAGKPVITKYIVNGITYDEGSAKL